MSPVVAYPKLVEKLRRLHTLGSVSDILSWDEQVNLPSGAATQRAGQMSAMAELHHAEASAPQLGELIGNLETELSSLDVDQQVVLRQARKDYDRAVRLPAEFVREKAELCSLAFHAWSEAKPRSDFRSFSPFLQKQLELAKREAAYLGWGDRPYDYMLDLHDPGMSEAAITPLFDELRRELVPFAKQVVSSPVKPDAAFLRGFDVEQQRIFVTELVSKLGFDLSRGRIDVSMHPFCSGSGDDVRLTTRFHEDTPLDAIFSVVHEAGHGMYEQGLPVETLGTALSMAAGMGVHESQSRLWENQVARSVGFWCHVEPQLRARFPEQLAGIDSEALYLAINAVAPTLIRIDSDEVTYNLHILLRYEIERRLFSGDLRMYELPSAWNEAAKELLGLEPANDGEGVLQDVHWSGGAFGYFPSYCLGNMLAAQLWYRLREELPDVEHRLASGDFPEILGWLRRKVHCRARRVDLLGLTREATGAELSPKSLLRYLRERYAPLYLRS